MSLCTEEEAKERWCPFTRTVERYEDGVTAPRNRVVVGSGTANSAQSFGGIGNPIGCQCIASQCMAWREGEPATHDVDSGQEVHPARGYCGLTGKP